MAPLTAGPVAALVGYGGSDVPEQSRHILGRPNVLDGHGQEFGATVSVGADRGIVHGEEPERLDVEDPHGLGVHFEKIAVSPLGLDQSGMSLGLGSLGLDRVQGAGDVFGKLLVQAGFCCIEMPGLGRAQHEGTDGAAGHSDREGRRSPVAKLVEEGSPEGHSFVAADVLDYDAPVLADRYSDHPVTGGLVPRRDDHIREETIVAPGLANHANVAAGPIQEPDPRQLDAAYIGCYSTCLAQDHVAAAGSKEDVVDSAQDRVGAVEPRLPRGSLPVLAGVPGGYNGTHYRAVRVNHGLEGELQLAIGASDLEARLVVRRLTGLQHPPPYLLQGLDRLRRNADLVPGSANDLIGRHAHVRRQCRRGVKEATLTVVVADARSSRNLASVYPCASGTRGRSERSRARLSNCRGWVGRVEPGCPNAR